MKTVGELIQEMHRDAFLKGLALNSWDADFRIVRWIVNHLKSKGVTPGLPHPKCKKRGGYEKVIYDFSCYARASYVEHLADDFDDFVEYLLYTKDIRNRLVHGKPIWTKPIRTPIDAWTEGEGECSEKYSLFEDRLSELKGLLIIEHGGGNSFPTDFDE